MANMTPCPHPDKCGAKNHVQGSDSEKRCKQRGTSSRQSASSVSVQAAPPGSALRSKVPSTGTDKVKFNAVDEDGESLSNDDLAPSIQMAEIAIRANAAGEPRYRETVKEYDDGSVLAMNVYKEGGQYTGWPSLVSPDGKEVTLVDQGTMSETINRSGVTSGYTPVDEWDPVIGDYGRSYDALDGELEHVTQDMMNDLEKAMQTTFMNVEVSNGKAHLKDNGISDPYLIDEDGDARFFSVR